MKRFSLLLAALISLALAFPVSAQRHGSPDMADDWRVSAIIGSEVRSERGEAGGTVHDILFSPAGAIKSIVVASPDRNGLGRTFHELEWEDLAFQPSRSLVRIRASALPQPHPKESPEFESGAEFSASSLLGKKLNLDDAAAYGEIQDLLVNRGANAITAFLVKPRDRQFLYVVPADFDGIKRNGNAIAYDVTRDQVESSRMIELTL